MTDLPPPEFARTPCGPGVRNAVEPLGYACGSVKALRWREKTSGAKLKTEPKNLDFGNLVGYRDPLS